MKKKLFISAAVLMMSSAAFSQTLKSNVMEKNLKSKTIVFIHGLFVNNRAWDGWKQYFEEKGYKCYAPAGPKHEGKPSELRTNPPEGLEDVTFEDWIDNLQKLISTLDEKPILIGHSFGGLMAQKLVESGRAEAAILISSAPPKGILSLRPSFLKANNPSLNFFAGRSVFNPKEKKYKKWFHFAFANTLTKEESVVQFEKYAVPESRRTHRSALRKIAKVDTKKSHVPLLFLGGLEDIILPNGVVRKNIKKYKDPNSIVDHKFFEDKSHYICGEPGWEKVADYAYQWLSK